MENKITEISEVIQSKLKHDGLENMDKILEQTGSIIAGSYLMQAVLNDNWTDSDIDIWAIDKEVTYNLEGYGRFTDQSPYDVFWRYLVASGSIENPEGKGFKITKTFKTNKYEPESGIDMSYKRLQEYIKCIYTFYNDITGKKIQLMLLDPEIFDYNMGNGQDNGPGLDKESEFIDSADEEHRGTICELKKIDYYDSTKYSSVDFTRLPKEYSDDVEYNIEDIVYYDTRIYISLQNNNSNLPGIGIWWNRIYYKYMFKNIYAFITTFDIIACQLSYGYFRNMDMCRLYSSKEALGQCLDRTITINSIELCKQVLGEWLRTITRINKYCGRNFKFINSALVARSLIRSVTNSQKVETVANQEHTLQLLEYYMLGRFNANLKITYDPHPYPADKDAHKNASSYENKEAYKMMKNRLIKLCVLNKLDINNILDRSKHYNRTNEMICSNIIDLLKNSLNDKYNLTRYEAWVLHFNAKVAELYRTSNGECDFYIIVLPKHHMDYSDEFVTHKDLMITDHMNSVEKEVDEEQNRICPILRTYSEYVLLRASVLPAAELALLEPISLWEQVNIYHEDMAESVFDTMSKQIEIEDSARPKHWYHIWETLCSILIPPGVNHIPPEYIELLIKIRTNMNNLLSVANNHLDILHTDINSGDDEVSICHDLEKIASYHLDLSDQMKSKCTNKYTLLGEDISTIRPGELIIFPRGENYFCITMDEFDRLVEPKVNPYTREPFDAEFLKNMEQISSALAFLSKEERHFNYDPIYEAQALKHQEAINDALNRIQLPEETPKTAVWETLCHSQDLTPKDIVNLKIIRDNMNTIIGYIPLQYIFTGDDKHDICQDIMNIAKIYEEWTEEIIDGCGNTETVIGDELSSLGFGEIIVIPSFHDGDSYNCITPEEVENLRYPKKDPYTGSLLEPDFIERCADVSRRLLNFYEQIEMDPGPVNINKFEYVEDRLYSHNPYINLGVQLANKIPSQRRNFIEGLVIDFPDAFEVTSIASEAYVNFILIQTDESFINLLYYLIKYQESIPIDGIEVQAAFGFLPWVVMTGVVMEVVMTGVVMEVVMMGVVYLVIYLVVIMVVII